MFFLFYITAFVAFGERRPPLVSVPSKRKKARNARLLLSTGIDYLIYLRIRQKRNEILKAAPGLLRAIIVNQNFRCG